MESNTVGKSIFRPGTKTTAWLIPGICFICMFLFMYAACSKLFEHQRFLNGLSRIAFIGRFAVYLSWLVPTSEFLISILLILPGISKWGLYGFIGLMLLFTGYITSMVLWAKELPCHCGGIIETLSWPQHIWFNMAFVVIASYALWLSKSNK